MNYTCQSNPLFIFMHDFDLKIDRPLVFLCGPNYDPKNKKDRRFITSNFIKNLARKNENGGIMFQMIPVIVDNLFLPNFMAKNNLSYKMAEEIVSSISFKTYIFLDTMSTSYEYGLFDNSLSKNETIPFLERGFESRTNCVIGDYIKLSREKTKFVLYKGKRDLGTSYINFTNNSAPEAIKKQIMLDEEELYEKLKNGFHIDFVKDSEGVFNNLGNILYSFDDSKNILAFKFDTKTFFYFAINCFSWKEIDFYLSNQTFSYALKVVKNVLFKYFMGSLPELPSNFFSRFMIQTPRILLNVGSFSDSEAVLRHILCIAKRMNETLSDNHLNGRSLKVGDKLSPSLNSIKQSGFNFYNNFFNFDQNEIKAIKKYSYKKDLATETKLLQISGKRRKIVMYSNHRDGKQLRLMHSKIKDSFEDIFFPSASSFAYCKNKSCKLALLKHIESNHFFKMDIHSFFNSIDIKILSEIISKRFKRLASKGFKRFVPNKKTTKKYIKLCFLKGELPLGFVTSPILSDIYLNALDVKISRKYKDIVYTRYADDILLSSATINKKINKCKREIEDTLKELKLELNTSKRAVVNFKNYGDSIHYLGANIVFKEKGNVLTISKRDLRKFAEKMDTYKKCNALQSEESKGIQNYIKNISERSFEIFKRTCMVRYGIDLDNQLENEFLFFGN